MLTHRGSMSALALAIVSSACGGEEVLHGLEEARANQVLVALDEAGVPASKARDEHAESAWVVTVARSDAPRARRVLAVGGLPRSPAPGFAEVFAKGGMVPTATEERALYLQALSGELARSIEAIEGVIEARVHLTLPARDPLRPDLEPAAHAAVLVKCRATARASLEAFKPGIQAVVAGAVESLEPTAVTVVLADSAAIAGAPEPPPALVPPPSTSTDSVGRWRRALASFCVAAASGCCAFAIRARRRAPGGVAP
jgi:type III secretion protein J